LRLKAKGEGAVLIAFMAALLRIKEKSGVR